MRTDPLRLAGWSVVALGALVFAGAAWRIAQPDSVAAPQLAMAAPAPITQTLAAAVDARAPMPVAEKDAYSGNTESKKFHRKSCRYYSCKNCTAKFATRDEARAAGYSPCGVCDP